MPRTPRIEIGGVARAHGIRGEIAIVTHDDETDLAQLRSLWIAGVEREIVEARDADKAWLVSLKGVATRNDAEALRGQAVEVDRDQLDLEDDDVLLADLVGCVVKLPNGMPWGTIAAVDPHDHHDLLVIHDGDIERLLPMVEAFVIDIDMDNGVVTVDPPEGLPEHKR